jgi:hypothetical protein
MFSQKQYKYTYSPILEPGTSKFDMTSKNSKTSNDSSQIVFRIYDKRKIPFPFAELTINNSQIFRSDADGEIKIKTAAKKMSFLVSAVGFTPLNTADLELPQSKEIVISVILGQNNELLQPQLDCLREIKKEELEKIGKKLSEEENDIQLIDNKTCVLSWQI